ncbi:hypothetical protein HDU97_001256 [Phlyctochytrium planicorne]|nr:hypothetical protein HDU97_001256 [Phlyctochytrium planicorne]
MVAEVLASTGKGVEMDFAGGKQHHGWFAKHGFGKVGDARLRPPQVPLERKVDLSRSLSITQMRQSVKPVRPVTTQELASGELGQNPDVEITRRILRGIAGAMGVMVVSCLVLQVLLPDPVRIFPNVARGKEIVGMFGTHFLGLYVVSIAYLLVVSPLFIWKLRGVKDAGDLTILCFQKQNGLKFQIQTTLILGIPFFILWGFLISMQRAGPLSELKNFIPAQFLPFLLFFIGHVTSVVMPLYRSFTLATPGWGKWKRNESTAYARTETVEFLKIEVGEAMGMGTGGRSPGTPVTPSSAGSGAGLVPWRQASQEKGLWDGGSSARNYGKKKWWQIRNRFMLAGNAPGGSRARKSRENLELTMKDFKRVLNSSRLFPLYKKFSASDFSIESALFHEAFAFLRSAVALMVEAGELPPCGTLMLTHDDILSASGAFVSQRGAVVGQFEYIWETFLKEGAMLEIGEVLGDGVRERVREGLESGRVGPDVLGEVAERNVEWMFDKVYPKFLKVYKEL